jgi:hypothetical protein
MKAKISDQYPKITLEQFQETIREYTSQIANVDKISMYQFCLTANGIIERSTIDLNICLNPECKNCREWEDNIKKEFNK